MQNQESYNDKITLTGQLEKEHEAILLLLEILKAISRKLFAEEKINPDHLEKIADFIKTFSDKCHHGKEENLLFPALEEAGVPKEGGPIGAMLEEHDIGRNYAKGLAEAISRYKEGKKDAAGKIAENAKNYVSLLSQHIDKENSILYPIALDCLIPKKQEELLVEFEKVEENIVGHGKRKEFHKLLEELKDIYLAE